MGEAVLRHQKGLNVDRRGKVDVKNVLSSQRFMSDPSSLELPFCIPSTAREESPGDVVKMQALIQEIWSSA